MNLVQGEIVAIMPPNFQDQWGNQYQDVTVRTAQGDIVGQKASKKELTQQDIGTQVEWNLEVKQNSKNQNYNKFTKPQDPQYGSQGSPQRPQGNAQATNTNQPAYSQPNQGRSAPQARDYDAENRGKIRTQFIKAAIIAGTLKCESFENVLTLTEFAMTGIDPAKTKPQYQANPEYSDNPQPPEGDIPF